MFKSVGGPPFAPAGEEAYKYNLSHTINPEALCLFAGIPRASISGVPFEIIQNSNRIVFLYELMWTFRSVPVDGRGHPTDLEPSFFGNGIGKWEGDTLVVDTVGLNDRTWLDTAGHEHSDQLHLVEKFQKTDNNNIKWTVTFEDPKFYTEPWSITLPIARQNTEIMSYSCEENEKDRAHLRRTKK